MCRNVPSRPSTTARYDTSPGPTESTRSCPSTGPRRSVGPSGSIARTSAFRLTPQSERQRGIAASAFGGTPSTVTPETDADGPALAVSRTTGRTVSTPGTASKRASGAAWRTGTSALRFSRTTTSAGTAYAAWSCSPVESVERYAAARDASASARAKKAAAVPAAPGDRASETPASRAPRAPPARASARPTAGSRRAAATAAANATRPGRTRSTTAAVPPDASSSGCTAPLARTASAATAAATAATSIAEIFLPPPPSTETATAITEAAATAVPRPSRRPVGESRLSVSTSQIGAPDAAATIAPAMMPTTQPTTAPPKPTAALSVPVRSARCHACAPCQVSRLLAAARSRRMAPAARTAKATRSAAASPPTSSSRRPATVAARSDSRSSCVGNETDQADESACSVARARSAPERSPSTCQSLGVPAFNGCTQP